MPPRHRSGAGADSGTAPTASSVFPARLAEDAAPLSGDAAALDQLLAQIASYGMGTPTLVQGAAVAYAQMLASRGDTSPPKAQYPGTGELAKYSIPTVNDLHRVIATRDAKARESVASSKRYGTDAADFLAVVDDDSDPYVVAGIIPEAMPAMIVGAPKSRKSWIMIYLAICVAAGLPAFGRPTKRGRVLVIAREDTARETRRRMRLVMRALGVEPETLRGWLRVDSTQPLYLDLDADLIALAYTLKEFRPSVCFVDSLSRVHAKNEDSKTEMGIVLNRWSDLCGNYSCSIVLLHHVVKWGDGATLLQRIRGSGDIGAVLRVAIGVTKRDESTSTIETDGNLADLAHPFDVRFADVEESGKRVALRIEADAIEGTEADADTEELIDELLAALLRERQATQRTLAKGRGTRREVMTALEIMVKRGLVRAPKARERGGYTLTEAGLATARGVNAGPTITMPVPTGGGTIGELISDIVAPGAA